MSGFTGTIRLVRLALRRDRITLPVWILGMAAFLSATTAMFADSYGKHPRLLEADTLIVIENPGMRVLGLVTGASVGGYTMHRDGLTLAVLAALMSVLAVVRHTRQAEELGRSEMLGAGVVGGAPPPGAGGAHTPPAPPPNSRSGGARRTFRTLSRAPSGRLGEGGALAPGEG